MMTTTKTAFWLMLTLALISSPGQQTVAPPQLFPPEPPVLSMQHLAGNPARCPLCRHPVDTIKPLTLLVEGDGDTAATLSLPVLVCPRDGVIFAVQP